MMMIRQSGQILVDSMNITHYIEHTHAQIMPYILILDNDFNLLLIN